MRDLYFSSTILRRTLDFLVNPLSKRSLPSEPRRLCSHAPDNLARYLDRFTGGRSGWLFGENPDIHNLDWYLPGREEMVLHSLRAAGEE
jgi:hypothetical protein